MLKLQGQHPIYCNELIKVVLLFYLVIFEKVIACASQEDMNRKNWQFYLDETKHYNLKNQ